MGVRAEEDGWVGFLSGGLSGASGLGRLEGVSGEHLFGAHVFGYLWGNATLVPLYVVRTRATRCNEAEYQAVDSKAAGARGRVTSGGQELLYLDVLVEEVRKTGFAAPDGDIGRNKLRNKDLEANLRALASPEAWSRARPG